MDEMNKESHKYLSNLPIPLLIFTSFVSVCVPLGEWANSSRLLGGTDIGLALLFGFVYFIALFLSLFLSAISITLVIIYKIFHIKGVKYLLYSFLIGLLPAIYTQIFGLGPGNTRLVMALNYIA